MKGSSGEDGFDGITEIGRQIGTVAKKQDLEDSRTLAEYDESTRALYDKGLSKDMFEKCI